MKGRHKNRLGYDWLKYVAVAFVSVLAWSLAFVLYHSPKEETSIRLFYAGTVKDYSIKGQVKIEGVDFFDIMSANPDDNTFATKYQSMALNTCDVALVPKSVADATYFKYTIEPLTEFYGKEQYIRDGETYGLYITPETKSALSAYFNFTDEEYVVMVCSCSVNAGERSLNSFRFLEWLVTYE